MMPNFETKKSGIVYFEVEEQIGILTISNGIQNKLNQADFLDLCCLKEWIEESELKGLVIHGKGRHFSAGAEIENIRENKNRLPLFKESLRKGKEILNYIESLPIITVAAISGVCFGGGLEIALSCHFRISTGNAVLAFPESTIGIMPGMAGTIRLPQIIGRSKALKMIISGSTITAEEASNIGLVDKIVSSKEHISSAKAFINQLTEGKSQQQIKNIIQSVNNSVGKINQSAMEHEENMFLELVKENK